MVFTKLTVIVELKVRFSFVMELTTGDSQFLEDETTKNFARKVADHYSRRTNQTLEEREASPIIHLKKLNNWVCFTHYFFSLQGKLVVVSWYSILFLFAYRLKVCWSSFMLVLTMLFLILPVGRFLSWNNLTAHVSQKLFPMCCVLHLPGWWSDQVG